MLRDIHFAVELFRKDGNSDGYEDVLLWLLGVLSRLNLQFLVENPATPRLYDSGVVYALPDQVADCRVDAAKLPELARYLQSIGASDETVGQVVRFVRGMEVFRDIPTLYKRGKGDCDNLAAARVAELWAAGIQHASPYLTKRPNGAGGTTYHALVLWPDGSSEDPSLILGMGGARRADDRRREIAKNLERYAGMVGAAKKLLHTGEAEAAGVTPRDLAAHVESLGLVPRSGSFRC